MERIERSLIEIEGMAMVGLIEEVTLEDCLEPEGWKKLVAVDTEGRVYETRCVEPQAAKRNFMVISTYARRWSKQLVEERRV